MSNKLRAPLIDSTHTPPLAQRRPLTESALPDNRVQARQLQSQADMMANSPRVLQQKAQLTAIEGSPVMMARRNQIASLMGAAPANGNSGNQANQAAMQLQLAAPLATPENVVQRATIWKGGNHPDNALDAFADALNQVVQDGADQALTNFDGLGGADGYTQLWQNTAPLLIAARDGTLAADDQAEAQVARQFGPARYGYAVEAYANAQVGTLQAALPHGYTFQIQGSRGMTRPDFIVFDALGQEAGWFDITSAGSVGHIDLKTGTGWQTKRYVAEITYPVLNTDNLSSGNSNIGSRVKARNSAKVQRKAWAKFVGERDFWFGFYYDSALSGKLFPTIADKKAATKSALQKALRLDDEPTDQPAMSLLRALGAKDVKPFGFKSGGSKASGETILRTIQDNF